MTDVLDQQLTLSAAVAESPVGDETVILHLAKGTYFGLDRMGTRIWIMVKEGMSTRAICERLADEFEVDLTTIESDARSFIGELEAQGIVVVG